MLIACGSAWRVAPRLVQAHVHPAGSAVRSRPFVSAGPFCRGSFALGTGRSPRRKPHGHSMWKRLAGRPTGDPRLVQRSPEDDDDDDEDEDGSPNNMSCRASKNSLCTWGATSSSTNGADSGLPAM